MAIEYQLARIGQSANHRGGWNCKRNCLTIVGLEVMTPTKGAIWFIGLNPIRASGFSNGLYFLYDIHVYSDL